MRVVETPLAGVLILEPEVFRDERGFLLEVYRDSWREAAGITEPFVQDNQSRSSRGVVRGLHYQLRQPQGKLVRTSRGHVFDVVVDVRHGSPQFGQWFGVELDDVAHRQLWIPPGFAHGFCALSDEADVVYRCTHYYDAPSNRGVAWDDPAIGIAWPEVAPHRLSAKDLGLPVLADIPAAELPVFGR